MAADLPNKVWKILSCPPGFSSLFILYVIVMWQGLRANQIALFEECVVHSFFMFVFLQMLPKMCCPPGFYFLKNGWTTRFFSMSDLLPFMLILEWTLWCQSHPPAYHHPVVCILDIITNKFTFSIEHKIWNKKNLKITF